MNLTPKVEQFIIALFIGKLYIIFSVDFSG